jgi:glycosyltransferase involved in cell wall biosynthesis
MQKINTDLQPKLHVGLVNTYIQGRHNMISKGLYPSHHLWGADMLNSDEYNLKIVPHKGNTSLNILAKLVSSFLRHRFGDLDQELEVWRMRNEIDILYVADGNLFFILILHLIGLYRPKIVRWRYTPRKTFEWWKFRELSNTSFLFRGTDLLLCLTNRATRAYKLEMNFLDVMQLDWGVDTKLFTPGKRDSNFFFACGKTNRDYSSLVLQAHLINGPIHLVIHESFLEGFDLPVNVHVGDGTPDLQNDRGISYPLLLKRYFHKALALLIPLKTSDDDSAGMTNLLEAMACGLPVVMTRSGALDINIEDLGIGIYVDPSEPNGWASACNWLLENPAKARAMGDRGRHLTLAHYNTQRLGSDLSKIFKKLCSPYQKV